MAPTSPFPQKGFKRKILKFITMLYIRLVKDMVLSENTNFPKMVGKILARIVSNCSEKIRRTKNDTKQKPVTIYRMILLENVLLIKIKTKRTKTKYANVEKVKIKQIKNTDKKSQLILSL